MARRVGGFPWTDDSTVSPTRRNGGGSRTRMRAGSRSKNWSGPIGPTHSSSTAIAPGGSSSDYRDARGGGSATGRRTASRSFGPNRPKGPEDRAREALRRDVHRPTSSVFSARRMPASGPESNSRVILTLPEDCDWGTRTEAAQKVPHAKPEWAVARTWPSVVRRATWAPRTSWSAGEAGVPR